MPILSHSHGSLILAACLASLAHAEGPLKVDTAGYPTTLSWKHGAPVLYVNRPEDRHLAGFHPDRTPLVWKSGERRIELHPMQVELRLGTTVSEPPSAVLSFRLKTKEGPSFRLQLTLPPEDYYEAPIRVIESGNWYQHVSLYGLKAVSREKDSEAIPIEGHIEWRAWPNGGTVEFILDAPATDWDSIEAVWSKNGKPKVLASGTSNASLNLQYSFDESGGIAWGEPSTAEASSIRIHSDEGTVTFNSTTSAWEISVPTAGGPNGPRDSAQRLDRITRMPFSIENTSEVSVSVPLRFIHPDHSITGFVPMLLDAEGRQTGVPIQVSKNWHTRKEYPDLANQGPWIRSSIVLQVPPQTEYSLEYAIVHARWQGVPIASGHQLSLVGWGSNGFWHQMALGSWGEHFCFQPGRVLRRSMFTDIRPLFQPSMGKGESYSWTSNVGGGDVGLLHDPEGRYLPWKDETVEYRAMGPNWSEIVVCETLANEAATLSTTIMLPRGDDFLRVFLQMDFEVHQPLPFSRFALLQFGTDYYASGQTLEVHPNDGQSLPVGREKSVPWKGENPWVWLESTTQERLERVGFGQRGLILRAFSGIVAGQPVEQPWLASHPLDNRAPNRSAELTVGPGVTQFLPGDRISAVVEMVVLPGALDAYIGPNEAFGETLRHAAGFAEIIAAEATENQITIRVENGPHLISTLPIMTASEAQAGFTIEGGQGLLNIKITGFSSPLLGGVFEQVNEAWVSLGHAHPEEANPQWTWNRTTQRWDLFLSLRPSTSNVRNFIYR